jgi:peptidoglycan/LPS O-acetylase OafA/YrhL
MSANGPEITARTHSRVFGLDALRAAAILVVVLSHCFAVLYPHFPDTLNFFCESGFYGVELFFVLSGFLIGQILLRTGPSIGDPRTLLLFYVRRWFRTLPLFYLFLAVNVIIEYRVFHRSYHPGEIVQHGLFLRTLTSERLAFFRESWSLAVEEWFYLLFPAALAAGLFLGRKFERVFIFAAAAFYLFSTMARLFTATIANYTWGWQRTVVVDRFDALMTGMFVAWIAGCWPGLWQKHARSLALGGATLLFVLYLSLWRIQNGHLTPAPDSFFARTFRFNLVSLGFALLLPAAAGWARSHENIASWSIRKVALWSYAMYLVNLPICALALTNRHFFTDWQNSVSDAFALFALPMVATIVMGGLIYQFFEVHCTRLREPVSRWILRHKSNR